jgi:hypothetical protein
VHARNFSWINLAGVISFISRSRCCTGRSLRATLFERQQIADSSPCMLLLAVHHVQIVFAGGPREQFPWICAYQKFGAIQFQHTPHF